MKVMCWTCPRNTDMFGLLSNRKHCSCNFFFLVALPPNSGSWSTLMGLHDHTYWTPHTWYDSSGCVLSLSQRPLTFCSVLYIRAQGIRPRCTAAVETYCATLLVVLNVPTFAAGPPSRPCYPRDPLAAKGGTT